MMETTRTNMKQKPTALRLMTTLLSLALLPLTAVAKPEVSEFYTQKGSDPSFESLLEKKEIPIGVNSKTGIKGSKISVNHEVLGKSVEGKHPIPKDISIHTLANSVIPRKDFPNWTRWYQEDGNTQIFRLFKGEYNVRNTRKGAPRVESFSKLKWGRGEWHEWEGTYTIVKPLGAAIFQAKSPKLDWSVMINLTDEGDIVLNHRRHQEDKTIAKNMAGKSFLLKVRDNGHEYEVFFNGEKVGAGHYDRGPEQTSFRWGMYRGSAASQDGLLFVTGARFK
jgi:hypothetical protein